jgi:CDP-diacylglycerol---serine O-phosphatidyltransferase
MFLKQLRTLYWPDILTLLGLLCVSFSIFFSYKKQFLIAFVLLLLQLFFDYCDGRLARAIGGGILGKYLDSFSDFLSVCASVVFGWFVGIDSGFMLVAGFLNLFAAAVRLAYFSAKKKKVVSFYTGLPTVASAAIVSALAFAGHLFFLPYIQWFVILYFLSAAAMVSDVRIKKI